jgi:hypothetical protein
VSRNSSRRRVTSCTGTSLNGASAYVSPPRAGVPPRAPLGFVRASIRRVQKGEISPPRAICDDHIRGTVQAGIEPATYGDPSRRKSVFGEKTFRGV